MITDKELDKLKTEVEQALLILLLNGTKVPTREMMQEALIRALPSCIPPFVKLVSVETDRDSRLSTIKLEMPRWYAELLDKYSESQTPEKLGE